MQNLILTHSQSAAATVRQFFRDAKPNWQTTVIAFSDDYSHGPLTLRRTAAEFFLGRREFWKSLGSYELEIIHEFNFGYEFILLTKALEFAEKAEIWIADSVQDLFFTTVVLRLLALGHVDTSGISLRAFSGSAVKRGLGSVRVEELETLYDASTSVPVDNEFFAEVWRAISQSSGEPIDKLAKGLDPSTPFAKALSAYLLRFPEYNGGLGSIERSLLGAGTAEMRKSAFTVGTAMAKGEPPKDHIGDLLLFSRLVELSNASPDPWFNLEGDTRQMRTCSAQITESGIDARIHFSVQLL